MFLIKFAILSIINVIGHTIRSLLTVKGNKYTASLSAGLYYAFYNIVIIYTVSEFALWQKCLITFLCNVVGTFIVKFAEEKLRKDRLWKIEFTVNKDWTKISAILSAKKIPYQYNSIGKHTMFTCFCATKQETREVKELINRFSGKYFITESKGE